MIPDAWRCLLTSDWRKNSLSGACFASGLVKVGAHALWAMPAYNIQQKIRLCRP
jgi:hypothetical protein